MKKFFFVLLAGLTLLLHSSGLFAAEQVYPQSQNGYGYFQTNGRYSEINNGDWWTNLNYGNSNHVYKIIVPQSVSPSFVLTLDVFDPESFKTNNDLDEIDPYRIGGNGRWDDTYYRVISPNGTELAFITFQPEATTSENWINLLSRSIGSEGPGIYRLEVWTERDDENGYKLRIAEDDPDGIPNSGDEIHLIPDKSCLQVLTPDVTETIMVRFFVPLMDEMHIYNFDMDANYGKVGRYDIINPSNISTAGTPSDDNVWNSTPPSVEFPTSGGDVFDTPEQGFWRAEIELENLNQIIFYPPPYPDQAQYPQLTLEKDDSQTLVQQDTEYTYTIVVTNTGEATAYNVTVTDNLPPQIEYVSSSHGGVPSNGNTVVTWSLGELAPSESISLSLSYRVNSDASGTFENCATVEYQDAMGDEYDPVSDCDINQVEDNDWIIGDRVWQDINQNGLQDSGEPGIPDVQVNLLDLEENILESTSTNMNGEYFFINVAAGDYIIKFIPPTNTFFTIPDVGTNDEIDSDPNIDTGLTSSFTVTAGESQLQWDAGLIRKKISDLAVSKSASETYLTPGEFFYYTITVINLGPDPAENVQVIDNLPAGITFQHATPEPASGPNPLIWNIDNLEPNEQIQITIYARANDQVLGGMDNHVFVSSENKDPNVNNNSASAQTHTLIPVELSSFTAQLIDGMVRLEWRTQSETNNAGFHIYRALSKQGSYERITETLISGAGNSQAEHVYSYIDDEPIDGTVYYKLADLSYDGDQVFHDPVSIGLDAPENYELQQNYPNPFNMLTRIRFHLQKEGFVNLTIYNTKGQKIKELISDHMPSGFHTVSWNGKDEKGAIVPSGSYIYSLKVNDFEQMQKMILIK